MENQDLYDDFERTFMSNKSNQKQIQYDQDSVYNSLHNKLNFKKQILESFRDYLEVVIKSIDDGEYNEKMIDELCDMIDGYYKNNDMDDEQHQKDKDIASTFQNEENRLALFSGKKSKESVYESDSDSSKTSKSSTKVNNKNNESDNDTSDSDDDNAIARFLDSDDDTPPIDIKKIVEKEREKRLAEVKKKEELEEQKKKEEKKVDRFYESFINKNIDINKRIFKMNTESISYLKNFTQNTFVY